MKRCSGVLLPVFSLRSEYGIGTLGKSAYEMIDWCEKAGLKMWQILPVGPTGYGDSPYQSFSAFAGNPYFIDLEFLIQDGLLTTQECDACDFGSSESRIDYGKQYENRYSLLYKAFLRFIPDSSYHEFLKDNESWLSDYALFMAIKQENHGKCWAEWPDALRLHEENAVREFKAVHKEKISFICFLQFMFYQQWSRLKAYAESRKILIIGDLPIYVAYDSADAWSAPKLFQFDERKNPIRVAGCPPDAFARTGQLWGNPLYDWEHHKAAGYQWWTDRIAHNLKMFDVIRVDHFRGFDEYYSIPANALTAEYGTWEKGPGYDIFEVLKNKLSKLPIIAEDLGYLNQSVLALVKKTGFPGMKVLQFAFDSREESDYLPHNYVRNCVVYTGTHDNDTLKGWIEKIYGNDRELMLDYLNCRGESSEEVVWDFIRMAMASVADLCIIPMQDFLTLGSEARINLPASQGGNWTFRLPSGCLSEELAFRIHKMIKTYGRLQ